MEYTLYDLDLDRAKVAVAERAREMEAFNSLDAQFWRFIEDNSEPALMAGEPMRVADPLPPPVPNNSPVFMSAVSAFFPPPPRFNIDEVLADLPEPVYMDLGNMRQPEAVQIVEARNTLERLVHEEMKKKAGAPSALFEKTEDSEVEEITAPTKGVARRKQQRDTHSPGSIREVYTGRSKKKGITDEIRAMLGPYKMPDMEKFSEARKLRVRGGAGTKEWCLAEYLLANEIVINMKKTEALRAIDEHGFNSSTVTDHTRWIRVRLGKKVDMRINRLANIRNERSLKNIGSFLAWFVSLDHEIIMEEK